MRTRAAWFWVAIGVVASVVFVVNCRHTIEQGAYNYWHVPLGYNLAKGIGYGSAAFSPADLQRYSPAVLARNPPKASSRGFGRENWEPEFLHMWGYAFLVACGFVLGDPALFVLTLQYVLCFPGIAIFYRLFNIPKRLWHIPLLLPFVAEMSVKWNQSVTTFLTLLYLYTCFYYLKSSRKSFLYCSGLILGIAANFRPEFFYLPFVQFVAILFPHARGYRKPLVLLACTSFLSALVCLTPWAIRTYSITSRIRFIPNYGGQAIVAKYIGEEAVEDSPDKPLTVEEMDFFNKEAKRLIAARPLRLAEIMGRFIVQALVGGVYVGEYWTISVSPQRFSEIRPLWRDKSKLCVVLELPPREGVPLVATFAAMRLSKAVLFILLVLFAVGAVTAQRRGRGLLFSLLLFIVLHRIVLISIVGAFPRYMSMIYPVILGGALLASDIFQKPGQQTIAGELVE
jgi:hypothetical protein